jgi:hypothetical protein
MSNMPPPLPPQYGQPQMPPPQQPPKKGLSGCAIAAIIIGVLIGIVVIGAGVGGYFVMKQVGGKGGLVKSVFAMANPDYDILDVDNKNQTITVRHKKTGKTATIPIAALKNGKIDPEDLGMTAEEAEGTGGAPSWVKYPHSKLLNSAEIMSLTTLVYRTPDSVDKVLDYYKQELSRQGIVPTSERGAAIVVDDAKGDLKLSVAGSEGNATVISIVYRSK